MSAGRVFSILTCLLLAATQSVIPESAIARLVSVKTEYIFASVTSEVHSNVTSSPDFSVHLGYVAPVRLTPGQTVGFDLNVTSLNGFAGEVLLAVDCPVDFRIFFSDSTVSLDQGQTVSIHFGVGIPIWMTEGTYCTSLIATHDLLVHTLPLQIIVPPFGIGTRLTHRMYDGASALDIFLEFPGSCFRVADWGNPTKLGTNFSLQITVLDLREDSTTCLERISSIGRVYELGVLGRGDYAFVLVLCLQSSTEKSCRTSLTGLFSTNDRLSPIWPANASLRVVDIGPTSLTLLHSPASDNVRVTKYLFFRVARSLFFRAKILLQAMPVGICEPWNRCGASTVSGLMPGTTHTFKVEACDAAKNCSSDGPLVTSTTLGGPWWHQSWWLPVLLAGAVIVVAIGFISELRKRRKGSEVMPPAPKGQSNVSCYEWRA